MLNLKSLRQRKADLVAAEKALRKEAASLFALETLSPEQVTRQGEIAAQVEKNEAEQNRAEAAIKNAEALAKMDGDKAILSDVEDGAAKDPMKGFKGPRDFLVSVIEAERGIRSDKRLALVKAPVVATVGSDEQSVASNPHGGFLVPEGLLPGLYSRTVENDPFANTTKVPMAAPIIRLNARTDSTHTTSVSGGLTVTRRPETVAGTASRMQTEQVTLNATSLFGLAYATEELLNDSAISFAALLQAGFRDEFMVKGIDEKINGSGAGMPEGIMSSPALISVAKEAGQAADTITYNNILAMRARCWGYDNAVWVANHDALPTLAKMSFVVGVGGSAVFVPNTNPATLLGRPLYFSEYVATVGDTGDILLVNPTQYLEGTYQPLQSAESVHVRFVEHERAFKFWIRNDGKCWWRAALTPKNSTATLSPFVKLDARA